MHITKHLLTAVLLTGLAAGSLSLRADDKPDSGAKKPKPYTLDHCVVSDEKFEGSDMKPYEFVHQGQTIKLCCKSCLKDFNADSAKYLKKIAEQEKPKKK